jgi:hypothetical protein
VRKSLQKSIDDSIVKNFDRYPKGSIVLCNACALPIFKLDFGIALDDKAGKSVGAFKPVAMADLETLATREDIDAGIRAQMRMWSLDDRRRHIGCLREMRTGDPMMCPVCADCFVQVLNVDKTEALDRAYTIELVTIPPEGHGTPPPVRGRQLGATKQWLH